MLISVRLVKSKQRNRWHWLAPFLFLLLRQQSMLATLLMKWINKDRKGLSQIQIKNCGKRWLHFNSVSCFPTWRWRWPCPHADTTDVVNVEVQSQSFHELKQHHSDLVWQEALISEIMGLFVSRGYCHNISIFRVVSHLQPSVNLSILFANTFILAPL